MVWKPRGYYGHVFDFNRSEYFCLAEAGLILNPVHISFAAFFAASISGPFKKLDILQYFQVKINLRNYHKCTNIGAANTSSQQLSCAIERHGDSPWHRKAHQDIPSLEYRESLGFTA